LDFQLLGSEFELLQRLAVAAGIGLLVGVERGWREREAGAGNRTAGVRTFTLTGLLGGIIGAIARALEDVTGAGIIIATGFFAFTAVFAAFRFREVMDEDQYGATTVVAAMATFALGVYALLGDTLLAAAIGVLVTVILAVREALHGWLHQISWLELRAGLVLAAMTVIALPIIPNEDFGPFGGINPREIWLLALVLAAVSFAGYVAVKLLGATHGVLVAAAAGGVVSSTAVNVTSARRAAKGEAEPRLLAASTTLATGVSFLRSTVLVAALNPNVALYAGPPLIVGALASLAVAYWMARDKLGSKSKGALQLRNPFSLREVLVLAAIIAVVKFASGAATEYFGSIGALGAAFIAGIADTDAIAYSMTQLAGGGLDPSIAGLAVVVANASNSLFKVVFGAGIAGRIYALPLAIGMAVPLILAALSIPFLAV
jgi:uncharacterized membrane protein (DUF4010 family)